MRAGDMFYFWAEETTLMVVMVGLEGVRVYDTKNPEFTDEGNIITKFVTYEELDEMCSYGTNVDILEQVVMNSPDGKINV